MFCIIIILSLHDAIVKPLTDSEDAFGSFAGNPSNSEEVLVASKFLGQDLDKKFYGQYIITTSIIQ